MNDVDCMACIANEEAPDTCPAASGPRLEHGQDERGVSHAFVRSGEVPHRGWWKCEFQRSPWSEGVWIRNRHPGWDI